MLLLPACCYYAELFATSLRLVGFHLMEAIELTDRPRSDKFLYRLLLLLFLFRLEFYLLVINYVPKASFSGIYLNQYKDLLLHLKMG